MRPKRVTVVDRLVIVLMVVIWLYEFQRTRDGLLFAALGVVIMALLYGAIQRSKAPPVPEAAAQGPKDQEAAERQAAQERAANLLTRRMTGVCLAFVVALLLLVGVQLLAARALEVHSGMKVDDRGRQVMSNHLWLGTHDLAWIEASLEGDGTVASQGSAFAGAKASIFVLGHEAGGLAGIEPGYLFDWELRFGWPLTVWRRGEAQSIGPGGVRWAVESGRQ